MDPGIGGVAASLSTRYIGAMTLRPEDDHKNWFTLDGAENVEGPAVVTALSLHRWALWLDAKSWRYVTADMRFTKLFIPAGASLKGVKEGTVSGYRLPV